MLLLLPFVFIKSIRIFLYYGHLYTLDMLFNRMEIITVLYILGGAIVLLYLLGFLETPIWRVKTFDHKKVLFVYK